MSVSRTLLTRSSGKLAFGGQTLYTAGPIKRVIDPKWLEIKSGLHGRVNYTKGDLVIKTTAMVFGEYDTAKTAVMFPASFTTPSPGTSLCSDATLVINAKNNEVITDANAFVSKVTNIYLGIDKDLWASEVEWTSLIASGKNPEDADAYYARSTGAYADTTFALTNFKRQRYSAAWGAIANFTALEFHEGADLSIEIDVQYDISANYGTCNAYVGENGLRARVSGIPLVTIANLDTVDRAQGVGLGALATGTAGTHSADMVITGSGVSITGKNMFIESGEEHFGIKPLRMGKVTWCSTSAFAAGTRAAELVIA